MATLKDRNEDVRKLASLIKGIKIGMLTTTGEDGSLHSRPMATQETPFEGDLWFFTRASSSQASELSFNKSVNVTYASAESNRYVSILGRGSLSRDAEKMRELWSPSYKMWFPLGLEDPELALIRVEVERAEYWNSPSSATLKLAGFLKAITGDESQVPAGEHKTVTLNRAVEP